LAWAALHGCPASKVRAAFHYVLPGTTVQPARLPEREELAALLATAQEGDRQTLSA
jgi:DNA helicase-2/ATP-dependent DNA helicase PcrA